MLLKITNNLITGIKQSKFICIPIVRKKLLVDANDSQVDVKSCLHRIMGSSLQSCPEVHHPLTTIWLKVLSGKPLSVGWPCGP